jgi:hypothetical protein
MHGVGQAVPFRQLLPSGRLVHDLRDQSANPGEILGEMEDPRDVQEAGKERHLMMVVLERCTGSDVPGKSCVRMCRGCSPRFSIESTASTVSFGRFHESL